MFESFACPFCGEPCELADADELGEGQHSVISFIQDCDVCCRPIQLVVEVQRGRIRVRAQRA